jgi:putative flavoprotein involved in K+ transport
VNASTNGKLLGRHDVAIVGAGPAGLGTAAVLRDLGIDCVVLERETIGASFLRWPPGMRFITPSFNSNQFGSLDLNSIAPRTSPAYSLGVEHPTGAEYAEYLRLVAKHLELPVRTGVAVRGLRRKGVGEGFEVECEGGRYEARFVVWAAGEFHYPRVNGFPGAELCLHNSRIASWTDLEGAERIVIGGSESGADTACALAGAGRRAVVLDAAEPWMARGPDPSVLLSPFTHSRLTAAVERGLVDLRGKQRVTRVVRNGVGFHVETAAGESFASAQRPILATGFEGSVSLVARMFEWRDDGFPKLTASDESTRTRGLFLVGPQVRQRNVIFCFVYKFRQRFAVVADKIARRMKRSVKPLEEYRRQGLFLDDLSCCGDDCAC